MLTFCDEFCSFFCVLTVQKDHSSQSPGRPGILRRTWWWCDASAASATCSSHPYRCSPANCTSTKSAHGTQCRLQILF